MDTPALPAAAPPADNTSPKATTTRFIDRMGVPEFIDVFMVSGLFVIIMVWLLHPPADSGQLMTTLVSTWATLTGVIVNFHRGSSASSKAKDDANLALIKNQEVKP